MYFPYEVRVQLVREAIPQDPPMVRSSQEVLGLLREDLDGFDREVMVVLMLDAKNRVLGTNVVSIGTRTTSFAGGSEIYKPVVLSNASGLILVHNHLSGDPTPSEEDKTVTHAVMVVARALSVHFLDHIIVGTQRDASFSFADEGLIEDFAQDIKALGLI